MAFITELWESVFTPGTTPALITATHSSFILLIISLCSSYYVSRSIHFFNLLVIAILLYITIIWFINELKNTKLKSNEEFEKTVQEKPNVAAASGIEKGKIIDKNIKRKA